jgi:hypothetical protein
MAFVPPGGIEENFENLPNRTLKNDTSIFSAGYNFQKIPPKVYLAYVKEVIGSVAVDASAGG